MKALASFGSFSPAVAKVPAGLSLRHLASTLAHVNRYGGQTLRPYPVAEHCVRGAWLLLEQGRSAADVRGFLWHDAHEALIGDITPMQAHAMGVPPAALDRLRRRWDRALAKHFPDYFLLADVRRPRVLGMDVHMLHRELSTVPLFGEHATPGEGLAWTPTPPMHNRPITEGWADAWRTLAVEFRTQRTHGDTL